MAYLTKKQKELLQIIYYDLDCINSQTEISDLAYHLALAKANLKDLLLDLKSKKYKIQKGVNKK